MISTFMTSLVTASFGPGSRFAEGPELQFDDFVALTWVILLLAVVVGVVYSTIRHGVLPALSEEKPEQNAHHKEGASCCLSSQKKGSGKHPNKEWAMSGRTREHRLSNVR
jgi:hypothetical protein